MQIIEIAFFILLGLIVYTYIGYPILLLVTRQIDFSKNKNLEPTVSLIITAHNEEEIIKTKLENSLALNHPLEKLQIIIASDGSTDGTVMLAEEHHEVEVLDLSRMGKTAAQNEAVQIASGEILVFSDANTLYSHDALKKLVVNFADNRVMCVCGELKYNENGHGENLYWRYEVMLKKMESRRGQLLGANGGIYAIRREAYLPLPQDAISDFVEPLMIYLRGGKVVYEGSAVAWESEPVSIFRRKRRIILRTLYSLKYLTSLLNPFKKNNLFIPLISHKIIRWFMPYLLILLFLSNVYLVDIFYFRIILLLQVLFYSLTMVSSIVRYYFLVNLASFMAIMDWLRGKKIVTWDIRT
ncbi:MAG: glycosyltransferase family 2 protein [Candidatus Marinimicrobia bacterium]|nr:glycosyltransferase family 2 protein [Candidatus Neomarinimicrobiota bacterium]